MEIEWAAVTAAAVLFTLGATSPGPSLAVVIANTIKGGRSRGIACALGHGLGFGFYAAAVVFGLVILMKESPTLFTILQIGGALFLIRMGVSLFKAKAEEIKHQESKREGFTEGFLIAFLNPKIAVFMLAVLASVLDAEMNEATKWILALLGMTIDATWYIIVAVLLTNGGFFERLKNNQIRFNQITGLVMISLALWVFWQLFSTINW
ncbi:MAG: lysine transporter LysE [Methanobacteriota archaeon]|jgi:threonine/homoserine/homoserine lactone efflux protein|nr:MAG: lysine transporter LysE [Euryarchaeota archaeon]